MALANSVQPMFISNE